MSEPQRFAEESDTTISDSLSYGVNVGRATVEGGQKPQGAPRVLSETFTCEAAPLDVFGAEKSFAPRHFMRTFLITRRGHGNATCFVQTVKHSAEFLKKKKNVSLVSEGSPRSRGDSNANYVPHVQCALFSELKIYG